MNLCSDGHDEVCYEMGPRGHNICPVCDVLSDAKTEINDLRTKVDELKFELEEKE